MAKEYKVGERYYLPVLVSDVVNTFIRLAYLDGVNNDHLMVNDRPDILLTAYEISSKFRRAKEDERIAELEKKNLELENENGKLTAKVNNLEAECEQYRQTNVSLSRTVNLLTASEDRNTHRAMLMDSLMMILLEKIEEMRR